MQSKTEPRNVYRVTYVPVGGDTMVYAEGEGNGQVIWGQGAEEWDSRLCLFMPLLKEFKS